MTYRIYTILSASQIYSISLYIIYNLYITCGLPKWLSSKEFACIAGAAGDMGGILGSGRSPGGGHGNPLQYSCLGILMERGAWRATVHGI